MVSSSGFSWQPPPFAWQPGGGLHVFTGIVHRGRERSQCLQLDVETRGCSQDADVLGFSGSAEVLDANRRSCGSERALGCDEDLDRGLASGHGISRTLLNTKGEERTEASNRSKSEKVKVCDLFVQAGLLEPLLLLSRGNIRERQRIFVHFTAAGCIDRNPTL